MTTLIVLESVIICLLILTVVAGLFFEGIAQISRKRKISAKSFPVFSSAFERYNFKVPKGLFFDKTHTWAFMADDGLVKIGIDDFFPHLAGQLSSIKMKESGEKIRKNEVFLSLVQDSKRLDIKSPVSGIIRTQNKRLESNTSLINTAPYSEGWVYVVEPTNWINEIRFFFMAEKFNTWLRSEFVRLKDFLAVTQNANETGFASAVLQEGGTLKAGILKDCKIDVWKKFQTNFIDIIN